MRSNAGRVRLLTPDTTRAWHGLLLAAGLSIGTQPVLAQPDSWSLHAPMPTAREKLATCVLDNRIHVLGGAPGANSAGLDTHERYNPATDSWSSRAPMPTGRRSLAAATLNGLCYTFGGATIPGRGQATVELYNPMGNSWAPRQDMSIERIAPAAATIGNRIYVVGGSPDTNQILNTLEAFDPAANQWTTLSPMRDRRVFHAAVAFEGKLWVIGGTNAPGVHQYDSVEIYDPATDSWSDGPSLITARAGPTASVVDGRIIVAGGGSNATTLGSVEEYDPVVGQWIERMPMPLPRIRLASAAVDGRMYAIGGAFNVVPPHPGQTNNESYEPAAAANVFQLNAGLNDAWYNPATDGQGFFINLFPDVERIFVGWFTFETGMRPDPPPGADLGEPFHRWLTAIGGWQGNVATLDVFNTSEGVFDDPMTVDVTAAESYGTVVIEFHDCTTATLSYDLFALDLVGEISIQRIVPDNAALCEALDQ